MVFLLFQCGDDFVAVLIIVENRGTYGCEHAFGAFRGSSGENPVALDEQPIVNDQLAMVLFCDDFGAEALARSAFTYQSKRLWRFDFPKCVPENPVHEVATMQRDLSSVL